MPNIKEFVYLNGLEVNSILSQLNQGLPTNIHEEQQEMIGTDRHSTTGDRTSYTGGITLGVNAAVVHDLQSNEMHARHNQTASSTTTDSVYNDFAVNIIIDHLISTQQLTNALEISDGEFIKMAGNYTFFDLSIFTKEHVNLALPTTQKPTELRKLLSTTYADTILVRINQALVFAETKYFRMNHSQQLL
ncbi:DUF6414 family protein [Lactiplantibacillus fabifermentans]|uniref:Uncharacterized protein n=2 Tax=Lactiplantibacillus fabifermentans TaxID=483011 RepID=A0A0R2NQE9_9LACO|nr:hypothetical protein [Lactiplantibacillus fabifermentans]ETY74573.1 hypothetical protein LFAB_06595 [Lactiplantibacillus fabifermentans T30PCM01]KRO27892.1 hypothetical protein DY78_GL002795 [Lactiplantibacillus fabifermentans DSM 21115]